jgi:hypothetical protein
VAGTSLLTLLDDIASLLDDVATMTKVATKKTAGVLGDDLALNAEQVTGVSADRELPVVWAVAVGSVKNKLILVPLALGLSYFAPMLVRPLLMVGGAFLCFEGFEKVLHALPGHAPPARAEPAVETASAPDIAAHEREKIRGAVRTDFVLSAEIIVLTLGAVAGRPFSTQVWTLVAVAALMTVGVYGLVAGIVKLDDLGLYLERRRTPLAHRAGRALLWLAPWLLRLLALAGTTAMFLVGGGLLLHGVPALHPLVVQLGALPLGGLLEGVLGGLVGVLSGAALFGCVSLVKRARRAPAAG